MKERLITLCLALLALYCFYALLFPKPGGASLPKSQPWSMDAGPDGYLALWRWLDAEHIPLASLRERYSGLTAPTVAPAAFGNLLIMTLPQQLPFKAAEWESLDDWVHQGNTVWVLAALDDTPEWTLGTDSDPLPALRRISQMDFAAASTSPSLREWLEPRTMAFVPQGASPLLRGVDSLYAISDLPASNWSARSINPEMPLRIARRADSQLGALWIKPRGLGQVIVCAFATPLSNRAIAHADNALLLSNIIARTRAASGRVVFDDAHQGLVSFYDPQHFFGDPRLHRTLLWLLLLWLVFVLGPQRLRAAPDRWRRVDETALIEASGRFYTQAVDPLDAQRVLFAHFFNTLRARIGLPENSEPVWEWLDAQAVISEQQRLALQDLYARSCAQKRVDLRQLHNLLSTLQGLFT